MHEKVNRLFLVSCVARKLPICAMAKDLYISDWFKKSRLLVENSGSDWYILSAKHGLIKPDELIDPYDETLNKMPMKKRMEWADRVIAKMKTELPKADEVVILAGNRYREYLMNYLVERFCNVEIPMEGLGIGKQIQWLKNNSEMYKA